MIAVIDYGMGNLRSVQKAFEFLGYEAEIVEDPERLSAATHLVLPGDAAFGDAMHNLQAAGWDTAIAEGLAADKPFLGICMGLQLMFEESEEMGLIAASEFCRVNACGFLLPSGCRTSAGTKSPSSAKSRF